MIGGCAQPGDVFEIRPYEFDDGASAPAKLVVVMGRRDQAVLFFLCTSKQKFGREPVDGCHPEPGRFTSNYFMRPPPKKRGKHAHKQRKGFSVPTWIVFEPQVRLESDWAQWFQQGRLSRCFELAEHEFRSVRACFERCVEYSPIHAEFL